MRGPAAAAAIALVNTVFSLGGFVGPSAVFWVTDATGSPNGALVALALVAVSAGALCSIVLRSHPGFRAAWFSDVFASGESPLDATKAP
jgi:nitrate/nitrite transporter NarK